MIWKARDITFTFDHPLFMGIVNLTPDSFYDGGKYLKPELALEQAKRLASEGADILDLGAESTRPHSQSVSEEEELRRLIPVLKAMEGVIKVPLSVDTTKANVARAALKAGVPIINDVSGLKNNSELGDLISEYGAGIVLMHRRGNPETMQSLTQYGDLMHEIVSELNESMEIAYSCGINPEQIVIDPGLGFAKTAEQNLKIIECLNELQLLGRPILIGPSRKSFIGHVTGAVPEARLPGTLASCVMGFERGARLFRVHDVSPIKQALSIAEAVLHEKKSEINLSN